MSNDSSLSEIVALLRNELGWNADSIPSSALEAGATAQMRVRGVSDAAMYLRELRESRGMLDDLIETIVVPETWFFRDGEPFRFLTEWARREEQATAARRNWRVLSLPCSTGEEPYSVVMALRLAGIAADRIRMDAVDISQKALDWAQAGLYGPHSFREKNDEAYRPFFTPEGRVWKVDDSIVSSVRFHSANALDFCEQAAESESYSIVFCRNLLIYLSESARRRLLEGLDRLLAPGGLFFLGHAEMAHVFLPGYRAVAHARSFAAQKPEKAMVRLNPIAYPPSPSRKPVPLRAFSARPRLTAHEQEQRLAEVERLTANRDWLAAEAECRALLDRDITCSRGWVWLGTMALERRRVEEAIEHLNRALYLEPYNRAALRRMSEAQHLAGREQQAEHYRQLAESMEATP